MVRSLFQTYTTSEWSPINELLLGELGGELYISESWICLFELGVHVKAGLAHGPVIYIWPQIGLERLEADGPSIRSLWSIVAGRQINPSILHY